MFSSTEGGRGAQRNIFKIGVHFTTKPSPKTSPYSPTIIMIIYYYLLHCGLVSAPPSHV